MALDPKAYRAIESLLGKGGMGEGKGGCECVGGVYSPVFVGIPCWPPLTRIAAEPFNGTKPNSRRIFSDET